MKKNEEQFNVRVPKELKEWVRQQAEKEDRSMNYIAVRIMQKGREIEEGKK
ncbi:MAG: Arc family DNA-binding protein [Cellvibrionaceae bacterium]